MNDEEQIQKDIEAMYSYLQKYQPEKASREYAAAVLDFLQTKLHDLALNDPEELLNLYESLQKPDREK